MDKSKDQMAEELAKAHYRGGMLVHQIFRLVSPNEGASGEPVKLLEVTPGTVAAGIAPVYFGTHPASGMVYPSVIVAITPDEFNDQAVAELRDRYGWTIETAYERPRRRKIVRR